MTTPERRSWLRDNAFLVAAVALPAAVALFFLVANAIPRWTVADPAYDLVVRATRAYDATPATVTVDFVVRDGRVDAVVRPAPPGYYTPPPGLFLFEHETLEVREIPLELPVVVPEGDTQIIAVEALASRRVVNETAAPDGYRVDTDRRVGSGLMGEIFGMGRYGPRLSLVKDGRVVPVDLPSPYQGRYGSQLSMVGWVVGGGT